LEPAGCGAGQFGKALGGKLKIIADFGDESYVLG
jgi:hypothetical protein